MLQMSLLRLVFMGLQDADSDSISGFSVSGGSFATLLSIRVATLNPIKPRKNPIKPDKPDGPGPPKEDVSRPILLDTP